MRKKLLSLLLVVLMVLGMFPLSALAAEAPFTAKVGGAEITNITEETLSWTDWNGTTSDVTCYKVAVPEGSTEATLVFPEEKDWTYYDSTGNYVGSGSFSSSTEHTVAIQDSNGDGELDGVSVQIPNAWSTEYYIMFVYQSAGSTSGMPFTAKVGGAEITNITEETLSWTDWTGTTFDVTCYKVAVPEGSTEATLVFPEEKDWTYYDSTGNYVGSGSFSSSTEHTVAIQDSNGDGELDGVSVQIPDAWSTEYYIMFVYQSAGGEVEDPCANGHTWDDGTVTTEPTCTAEGVKTFTCGVCSETKTEAVSKLEHTYSEETDKCSCGALNPEHVHDYGEYTQTKAPTCTDAGTETGICKCGANDTKTIDATGHSFTESEKFCVNGCNTVNPDYVDPNVPAQDENGVYQIATAEQLMWFAEEVTTVGNTTASAVLTADIDLTGKDWTPIGDSSNRFAGTFDGNGHSITFDGTFGLFLYVRGASDTDRAEVKNLVIEGSVKGAGIACTAQFANFENCINRADVTADERYAAGIVANSPMIMWNDVAGHVKITNCANEGNITGAEEADSYTGGILGYAIGDMIIAGCSNSGNITGGGNVGGIGGYCQGSKETYITDCYNIGKITTGGGIVGTTHNGVIITNCYNAGEADYAITTEIYNRTTKITNTYWLVSASVQAVPLTYTYNGENGSSVDASVTVTSITPEEMASDEFITLLGGSFKKSCPAPVLSWQTVKEHDMREIPNVGTVCLNCGLGTKSTFDVTKVSGEGYTITGEDNATEGEAYTFTVEISEGYAKGENFTVMVGTAVVEETDGVYTWESVVGPLRITVTGVEKIPDEHTITLPKTGNGYYVVSESGYDTTVKRGADYKFTVAFANGFRAGESLVVTANGVKLTADENGVYTISGIVANQTIEVAGTEMIPYEGTVSVNFTITSGLDEFYESNEGAILAQEVFEVPYFDLELYGLEQYYYNPYCYVDADGNPVNQTAGNKETAYGVITAMHAYIYATEVYYLGMDPADAGKGFADEDAEKAFNEAVSWTQGAGSSFLDLWGDGTNLNYYINYIYPLGREEWGATSDQIALNDGDIFSVHFIESNASGSNFGFFVADDDNTSYESTDTTETKTVKQGDKITLSMYNAGAAGNYLTGFSRMKDQQLFWVEEENLTANIYDWHYHIEEEFADEGYVNVDFGNLKSDEMVTDENGCITIDTAYLAPGTYYIASKGGISEGGMVDSDGFTSRGNEAGPALFVLVVEGPEYTLGDVNGDGKINAVDAALTYKYVNNKTELTEEQLLAADVNGDGKVNAVDAALIYKYVNNKLDVFPAEQ